MTLETLVLCFMGLRQCYTHLRARLEGFFPSKGVLGQKRLVAREALTKGKLSIFLDL